jgi:DNA-binding transcriptional regulator YdaS (Cro superfamily)
MDVTPKQLRLALDRLALSQLALGRLLGVSGRTVRSWVLEERKIPEPVAIIVRLMLAGKITAEDIEQVGR